MVFKILFYLIFLLGIVFTIFSTLKYKSLNSIEKEYKQELFLSRTKFVIISRNIEYYYINFPI